MDSTVKKNRQQDDVRVYKSYAKYSLINLSVCLHNITSVSIDERGSLRHARELLGHEKRRRQRNARERPDMGGQRCLWGTVAGTEGQKEKGNRVRSLNLKLGAKGEGVGWRQCARAVCLAASLPPAVSMATR